MTTKPTDPMGKTRTKAKRTLDALLKPPSQDENAARAEVPRADNKSGSSPGDATLIQAQVSHDRKVVPLSKEHQGGKKHKRPQPAASSNSVESIILELAKQAASSPQRKSVSQRLPLQVENAIEAIFLARRASKQYPCKKQDMALEAWRLFFTHYGYEALWPKLNDLAQNE